jgi:ribosomal protein L40E
MSQKWRKRQALGTVCWQCQARLRKDQLICAHCGATRPTASMSVITPDMLSATEYSDGWRQDTRSRAAIYVPGGVPDDARYNAPAPTPARSAPGTPFAAAQGQRNNLGEPQRHAMRTLNPPAPFFSKRRARELARVFLRETAEVWRATGFALLGALIGGGAWFVVALAFHYESGFIAVAMGALVGEGVAVGVSVRRQRYTLYALGLLAFCWALCIRLLNSHHLGWSPLDGAYFVIACVACAWPLRRLPPRSFHTPPKAQRRP